MRDAYVDADEHQRLLPRAQQAEAEVARLCEVLGAITAIAEQALDEMREEKQPEEIWEYAAEAMDAFEEIRQRASAEFGL